MHKLVPMFVAVLLAAAPSAMAQSHEERVRELLDVMRAGEMGVQFMKATVDSLRQSAPELKAEFWSEFMSEIQPEGLVDLLVPIYVRHLTPEDVEELIRFYSSPTGQRFLDRQPQIMQESMAAGERWGFEVATLAMKRIESARQKPD